MTMMRSVLMTCLQKTIEYSKAMEKKSKQATITFFDDDNDIILI